MAKIKHLFRGNFNFRNSLHIERCMAYTEKQAFYVLCRRIAKKMGVSTNTVFHHFKGGNKYELSMEIKYEEVGE